MSDYLPESEFSGDEIASEMAEVSNEFREWLQNGFESDLKKQALRRLSAKREGQIVDAKERQAYEKAFQPDTDPREVEAINARLNQLYSKPSLSKDDEAERKELTSRLQGLVKRHGNSSSKAARDW
jgi:hypothetical protein